MQTLKVLKESTSDTCLICLPFVGAYWAAFTPVTRNLKGDFTILSVTPPGHAGDTNPALDSIEDMADLYLQALEPYLNKQLIFLGYSLGGLVTHCMLRKLKEQNRKIMATVVIAASVPPHLIQEAQEITGMNNDQIIKFFHSIGGIPDVLLQERELLERFIPVIKADYKAFETYRAEIEKFDHPAFLLYGKRDNFISYQKFTQWETYFENTPVIHHLEGGHLFIRDSADQLTEIVQEIVNISVENFSLSPS